MLTGKFHFTDAVALFFDPQVGVMLSHRDLYKEQLFIPVELQFQATAAVSLKVLSGVSGQLSALGDTYQVPLGLGLVGNVSSHLDLGLRFSFDNLLGHVARRRLAHRYPFDRPAPDPPHLAPGYFFLLATCLADTAACFLRSSSAVLLCF